MDLVLFFGIAWVAFFVLSLFGLVFGGKNAFKVLIKISLLSALLCVITLMIVLS